MVALINHMLSLSNNGKDDNINTGLAIKQNGKERGSSNLQQICVREQNEAINTKKKDHLTNFISVKQI